MFNGDARLCWKTLFQKRTITTTGNTTDYLEPISNTNANYQELSPNNIYHELNSNTNYQELKIQYVEINQYQSTTLWSYAIYFLYVSVYKYFFSLGLKCHIFMGLISHVTAKCISIFVWGVSIIGKNGWVFAYAYRHFMIYDIK